MMSYEVSKETYRVKDIMKILDIGRKKAYEIVKENHFKYKKIGSDIRINKQSFDDWLNSESNK